MIFFTCMRLLLALGAILIVASLGLFILGKPQPPVTSVQAVPSVERGEPAFSWSYREHEKDSIPYTDISLTASYADGTMETKVIDTVEGNCNGYEEADPDIYERSSMIICYYAGLGRYFKVVEEGEMYAVQRKVFEEASPEYEPAPQPYETVARF